MIAISLEPPQPSAYVASPGLFRRRSKPLTPDQLKDFPCIGLRFRRGRRYAWEFEREGVSLAIEISGRLCVGEQDLAIQAALDGAGIAFAFESQVGDLLEAGRLERVLEDWSPTYRGFYLYYPSRRLVPPALAVFVSFVKAL